MYLVGYDQVRVASQTRAEAGAIPVGRDAVARARFAVEYGRRGLFSVRIEQASRRVPGRFVTSIR